MFYQDYDTVYEGFNPLPYLYGENVYDIMYDVMVAELGLTDDEMAIYLGLIEGLDEWAVATISTLTWEDDEEFTEWSITNRDEIHTALLELYTENGIVPEDEGITTELIDSVLDRTIDVLIYGDEASWTSEGWEGRMTEIVNDLEMTDDDFAYIVLYEVPQMEIWMETYTEDYEQWLVDNDEAKDTWVTTYYDLVAPYLCLALDGTDVVEDCTLPAVWQQFFELSWDNSLDMTNKEQKKLDNLEDLEAEHQASIDYDRWDALYTALNTVFTHRLTEGDDTVDGTNAPVAVPD